jgi:hypothetical protein
MYIHIYIKPTKIEPRGCHLNTSITSNETEAVIKSLPKQKSPEWTYSLVNSTRSLKKN